MLSKEALTHVHGGNKLAVEIGKAVLGGAIYDSVKFVIHHASIGSGRKSSGGQMNRAAKSIYSDKKRT